MDMAICQSIVVRNAEHPLEDKVLLPTMQHDSHLSGRRKRYSLAAENVLQAQLVAATMAAGSAQRDDTVAPVTPRRVAAEESLEDEVYKLERKETMLSRLSRIRRITFVIHACTNGKDNLENHKSQARSACIAIPFL